MLGGLPLLEEISMADLDWINYSGVVTGATGALTGIAGAIMGVVSIRRTTQIKALDLRLELRKASADLCHLFRGLRELIDEADRSRVRVLDVTGGTTRRNRATGRDIIVPSARDVWSDQVNADRAKVGELEALMPDTKAGYAGLPHETLETKLVEVHSLQTQVSALAEKYKAALAKDDNTRREIARARQVLWR
ncbi:hypothetical protein CI15_08755 [Paraburkholderia monticola]|uniref:Uncharacterized protein n=1 Tax=Paraburkholderia monticola TaxID=1399968 RepID=A0A149PVS1_9BURK|nr:hypothetical protein CI15_08755 [Paraburkholderia monticola]